MFSLEFNPRVGTNQGKVISFLQKLIVRVNSVIFINTYFKSFFPAYPESSSG